ncbi:NUDIX hydrolase [Nocardioides sp.]|uniref:NUDIX hydrolase n=1 Tax=Nocardioides sp. TaxID=35761 RepID=UPI0039E59761
MRISLPPSLIEKARAYADGSVTPVEPRDAATVLLLRPGADGPEVFVMRRRTSMAFAGGMVAFPGGGVAPEDVVDLADGWVERLGAASPVQAAAVVAAAVRELEEETGVILAPSELGLWDAWTTPVFETRRYRTWFFTALLPEGQEALELSTESSSVEWVSPAAALDRADAGEWTMLPPTYGSMLRLATFSSVEEVMAETVEARVAMFTPTLEGELLTAPDWMVPLLEARRR